MAEFISCVNCSSSAPSGLVWRAVSDGAREVLLEYPDLLMDTYAIWNRCPRLTVLVTSEPGRRAQRDAIRATWGHLDFRCNCSYRVVFFMSAVPRSKQHYALKEDHGQLVGEGGRRQPHPPVGRWRVRIVRGP
ncbi:hypothetical protein HPB52_006676 [Rhipicephalus sanguineus]|uniref:Hexosyltransferase n=1 Tax=Rhipicephalus sanguineus TaxID=34632 RepID=A0A9D4PYJ1_RHISA|nr:hypothetical protein HPB52_006676 [Rhipicephalus sanguineus]